MIGRMNMIVHSEDPHYPFSTKMPFGPIIFRQKLLSTNVKSFGFCFSKVKASLISE